MRSLGEIAQRLAVDVARRHGVVLHTEYDGRGPSRSEGEAAFLAAARAWLAESRGEQRASSASAGATRAAA
jgi:hypothetical protein